MGKAVKSTRKFVASGQLKKTIQNRKKHQQIVKKAASRRGAGTHAKQKRGGKEGPAGGDDGGEDDAEREKDKKGKGKSAKGMSVDDLLGANFADSDADDDEDMPGDDDDDDDADLDADNSDEDDDDDDDQSFASVDDLDDEGANHLLELSALAQKDPEFYKYLQDNDRELLDFDGAPAADADADSDEEDGGFDMDVDGASGGGEKLPVLTREVLKGWQKALLEHRSLRALRKLLIAFRSAAHMNEDGQALAWTIDSASVYNKLVTTALKYTPVVLEHHIPYKTLPNGKFKPPTQTPKQKALQKLLLSYFHNIIHLLDQLTEPETVQLALAESAKIVPYVVGSRKAIRAYLKKCLELWSSAEDNVRIAAFLAIRKLASSTDESILDIVLKNTYLTLIRSSKSTTAHTLPSINLMKNSASEVFCLDHAAAYQHAFGYIRQLAIHLRNSMKVKTKEAYKQVYNWQYVHCIDFWAIVLARACDSQARAERGGEESELKPLLYPLVQVSLGAIKLISNARSHPFHLQIARSLVHLTRHTHTYVPLAPYLLPVLTATLVPSARPKASTLRPLDLEVHIRTPQQYLKTRVYGEGVVEESAFVLGEWLASAPVQGSVAFPELVVPLVVVLRKALKAAKSPAPDKGKGKGKGSRNVSGKDVALVKGLVERVEESARWVEEKRKGVGFAPGMSAEVEAWEAGVKVEDSPLGRYVRVQRKTREKRRALVDKARDGEDEILED